MIKMLTAYTMEIDEAPLAVAEILSQLDLQNNLLPNAIGIVSCYEEFVSSGVWRALCQALPFDVVGITTLANGTQAHADTMQLCLTVITADDVSFAATVSKPLNMDTIENVLQDAYQSAKGENAHAPAMVLPFLPLLPDVAGELLFQKISSISQGAPVFGSLTCDHTIEFAQSVTLYNGEDYQDAAVLVLFFGNFHPRFYAASVSPERVQRAKAVITDADGFFLRRVNDVSVVEHMQSLGLGDQYGLDATRALPFIIDYNDGSEPVARAILNVTPDGGVICCGFTPVGATLSIASVDYGEVLKTASETADEIKAFAPINGILVFSCVVRSYVLGTDVLAEIEGLQQSLGSVAPYMISYSGGELCPVSTQDAKATNRFHNFTVTACAF